MGSLAKRQFSNLVFKFMLFSCWYPVTHAIPSRYLHFHIICPCCLSEKKKKEVSRYNSHKFCLFEVSPPQFFSPAEWCPIFHFGVCFFFREDINRPIFFLSFPSFSFFFLSSLSFLFLNFFVI